ncbi:hypothetical protein [Thermotoga sp. KOL6]|uniref:hypothetical protein n=1 Tax=Thermotoga sp. KOL6 TaxID=126741 RepID=UPI0013046A42|nr:hypothetical protein [Thermotoga sp. KOL6]
MTTVMIVEGTFIFYTAVRVFLEVKRSRKTYEEQLKNFEEIPVKKRKNNAFLDIHTIEGTLR